MGIIKNNDGYLGIDIGSFSIKIVEIKKISGEARLMTYGYSERTDFNAVGPAKNAVDNIKEIAAIIGAICKKMEASSHSAVAALPSYAVFSSIVNLPAIASSDIVSAINLEAKKIIPMPIEEIILNWKEIGPADEKGNKNYLLTGAPRILVKKYIDIFKEAHLNLLSLETETFSLIRSLIGNDQANIMVVEIGANTTSIFISEKNIPVLNRSLDVGGSTVTAAISQNLKIGPERAEQFKYDLGASLSETPESVVPKIVLDTISQIINEIKYSLNFYQERHGKKVEKIILSGGSALLGNLDSYLANLLNVKTVISSPWGRVSYPVDLKPVLDEIGPRLSIAVGLAMREAE